MRKITVYQEGETIRLFDDNSASIQDTSKEISKLMQSSNISILITSVAALVLRPSKINSILIEDIDFEDGESEDSLLVDTLKDMANDEVLPTKVVEQEDVITDIE